MIASEVGVKEGSLFRGYNRYGNEPEVYEVVKVSDSMVTVRKLKPEYGNATANVGERKVTFKKGVYDGSKEWKCKLKPSFYNDRKAMIVIKDYDTACHLTKDKERLDGFSQWDPLR